MELVKAAERYKEDGPCISPTALGGESMNNPLGNFLDDVALIADLVPDDENDSEGGSRIVANLMTIHSSKGMEFDAVFLVGNEDGTLPTQKAIGEGEGSIELAEERRLCYVAMTRAKTHLVLTWRKEVSYFAGAAFRTKDAIRSRFLDVLVSKKRNKAVDPGPKPSNSKGQSNPYSTRKGTFTGDHALDSILKRELHSEANKYLKSAPSNLMLKPKSNRSNKIERKRTPSNSSSVKGSMTKNEVDSLANRCLASGPTRSSLLPDRKDSFNIDQIMASKTRTVLHSEASNKSASRRKSLDDWEPSSLKNLRAADKKGVPPSFTLNNSPVQNTNDKGKVIPQSRVCQNHINLNKGQTSVSSQGLGRSCVETSPHTANQTNPPIRSMTKNRLTVKEASQTERCKAASWDTAFGGEAPPEMDSTMFFPVGSSVKHKLYGQGIVQTPPDSDKQFTEKSLVRVKFLEDNLEWDLPMDGLVHTYK